MLKVPVDAKLNSSKVNLNNKQVQVFSFRERFQPINKLHVKLKSPEECKSLVDLPSWLRKFRRCRIVLPSSRSYTGFWPLVSANNFDLVNDDTC